MRNAVVVDANDVKDILAKHFKVPAENVIKSQYTYTVIIEQKPDPDQRKASETAEEVQSVL